MRSSFLAQLALGALLLSPIVATAQTGPKKSSGKKTTAAKPASRTASLKDGVFFKNGMTMRLRGGQVSRLTAPLTLSNGTVVQLDGSMTSREGTRSQLTEGRAVTMQGNVVTLTDDMLTPQAIEQRARLVTGESGITRIAATPPAPGGSVAVPARITAQLLLAEQRMAILQAMGDRLASRATGGAATAALDAQLTQVDAALQQATPSAAPAASPTATPEAAQEAAPASSSPAPAPGSNPGPTTPGR